VKPPHDQRWTDAESAQPIQPVPTLLALTIGVGPTRAIALLTASALHATSVLGAHFDDLPSNKLYRRVRGGPCAMTRAVRRVGSAAGRGARIAQ